MNIYIENTAFWNHIVFSFETLLRSIHENDVVFHKADEDFLKSDCIYYGKDAPKDFQGVLIQEGDFFSDLYLKKEGKPSHPLQRYRDIPVLFLNKAHERPSIVREGMAQVINFDIIQSTFYLVAGCEEIIDREKEFDIHGRYLIRNRLLYKEKMLFRPLVNIYAHMLKEQMKNMGFQMNQKEYPAYAHISHDVDVPYEGFLWFLKWATQGILDFKFGYRLHKGFDFIETTEKKYGIHSSWYFMSGGNNKGYERGYELSAWKIQKLISKIRHNGNEIGWHYSYNAANDYIQMKREQKNYFECMRNYPRVGRNHYLRYNVPESWRMYARLGLQYDATLASAQHEGFVYGICTPFQLFDAISGINLGVWEIPLLVMDGTVCGEQYRGLSPDEVMESIHTITQEVKKYSGVFSILWHNSNVKSLSWKKWEKTYAKIMEEISREFICSTGEEIVAAFSGEVE